MSKSRTSGSAQGSQNQSSASSSVGTSNPWDPAVPLAKDFLGLLGDAGGLGLSGDQQNAFGALKSNALQGNPWASNMAAAADGTFNAAGNAANNAQQGYNLAMGALAPTAQGQYVDPMSNPYTSDYVDQVQTDAFDRIRGAFAGAGRHITGNAAGLKAAAEGVTHASLPILFNQYNKGRTEQLGSAQAIPGLANTANTGAMQGAQLAQQGSQMAQGALDARNYSAERMIDLDQAIKSIPYQDLAAVASLLFPAAGLGGTSTAQGSQLGSGQSAQNSKSTTSGFNLGALFSDRRLKVDIEQIGASNSGTPIYRYRYIAGGPYHIGFMADEAPAEAVGEMFGFKTVDYKLATEGDVQHG